MSLLFRLTPGERGRSNARRNNNHQIRWHVVDAIRPADGERGQPGRVAQLQRIQHQRYCTDGRIRSWANNSHGELGDGSFDTLPTCPSTPIIAARIEIVFVFFSHAVFVMRDL